MHRLRGGASRLSHTTTGVPARTTLVRDSVTWLIYLQVGVYGYFLYGFGPSLPLLRDQENISRGVAGLHSTAMAIGTFSAGLLVPALVARFGRARARWLSLIVLSVGIGMLTAAPVLWLTLAGALVCGFGGSVIVTVMSAALAHRHPGPAGSAAMSEANAIATAAGIVSPLLIGVFVWAGIGWRAGLLITPLLVVALYVMLGRREPGAEAPVTAAERPAAGAGGQKLPRRYWRAWGVMVMAVAIEFCMTIWSGDELHTRLGLGEGVSAAGVTAIVLGMTVGRLAGGRLALRLPIDALLTGAFLLSASGFFAFWMSPVSSLAYVGLLVAGLGMSLHFPLSVSRAIAFAGGRHDLASARLALGTGLAIGLAPFVLGAVADHVGTHHAFLVVPVLTAAAIVGVGRPRRFLPSAAAV